MTSTLIPSVTLNVTVPSFQSMAESYCMPATIAIDPDAPNTLNAQMSGSWLIVPKTGSTGGNIIFKMVSADIIFIGIALKSATNTAGNNSFYQSAINHTTRTLTVSDVGTATAGAITYYEYIIVLQQVSTQTLGYIDPGIINNPNAN